MNKHLLPILAFLLSATSLFAAVTDPIAELRVPDKTKWIVVVQISAKISQPHRPRTLVQTTGEKDNGLYRVLNRYDDQTVEEFWITPHLQYLKTSGRDKVARLLPSQSRSWNLGEADFPELYWAVGQIPQLQKVAGQNLLVIKMDAAKKPLSKRDQRDLEELNQISKQAGEKIEILSPTPVGALVLYLNPNNRLPIRFEDIDKIYNYSFEKSQGLESAMPEDMKKEIMHSEKELAEISRPASAPKIRNPQSAQ